MHKGCALGQKAARLLWLGTDRWHVLRSNRKMPFLWLPVLPREDGSPRGSLLVKAKEVLPCSTASGVSPQVSCGLVATTCPHLRGSDPTRSSLNLILFRRGVRESILALLQPHPHIHLLMSLWNSIPWVRLWPLPRAGNADYGAAAIKREVPDWRRFSPFQTTTSKTL